MGKQPVKVATPSKARDLPLTKTCTCCKEVKLLTEFKLRSDRANKLRSQCKVCDRKREYVRKRAKAVARRAANPYRPDVVTTKLGEWLLKSVRSSKRKGQRKQLTARWIDKWQHVTHCPISGLPFKLNAPVVNGAPHPQAPSLDRIDPSAGYTEENTRVVCCFVNFAKNAWTQEQFEFLIQATASNLRH